MFRINFLQLLLVALLVLSAVAADGKPDVSQSESLQDALDDLNAASFHDALHVLSAKFRHGIFQTDLHAAEALQDEEPTIASLMRLAKRDNATASPEATSVPLTTAVEPTSETTSEATSAPTTEQTTAPTTTEQPTTSVPTTEKTTAEPTTSVETTTSVPQTTEKTTSKTTEQPTTAPSTTSSTSSHTTAEPTTASVPTTSQTTQHTTSVPSTLSTATSSSSSTSSHESTSHSTEHTSQTSLTTSTFKSTSTRADGSFTTLTSVTVITPAAATGGSETNAARPGLQTGNAAAPTAGVAREVVAMVGGAMMVAMAL